MHTDKFITAGVEYGQAEKVLILVHGRGGTADAILNLAENFNVKEYTLIAPQATNHSWYPQSFLAVPETNEPWLSSALNMLKKLVKDITDKGIPAEKIYFLGFSQGACLTLEFVARNAMQYGGIVAFTGGLIGDKIYPENYEGDFNNTPVLIATSDPDPHVPVTRVYASVNILKNMNAAVIEKVYANMGHTISNDEIELANTLIFT